MAPFVWTAGVLVALLAVVVFAYPAYAIFHNYLLVPLRHWGKPHLRDAPLVEADIATMPARVSAYMARAARQLVPLGFSAAANLRAPEHSPGSDGYVSVWLNEAEATSVQVIVVWHEGSRRRTESFVTTFLTEFGDHDRVVDGGAVSTSSTPHVSVFAPHPRSDFVRWPAMNDLATLYRLHRFRADGVAPREKRWIPPRDGIVAYLHHQAERMLRFQVEAGYYWFDPRMNTYRPRLRGAFMMTWSLLWPLRQRADRANEAKLRRDLAAAGMPPPEEHRPHPPDEPPESSLAYRRPGHDDNLDGGDDADDDKPDA
jgi:hypothetical protein